MENKNENNTSIIPIGSNGLIRVSNSIAVTNKLLTESKFQFSGDFKGEQIWKVDGHKMAVRQIIIADNILNNKSCLISAGEDGFITLYDLSNGDCIFKWQIENNWLTSIAVWNDKLLCAGRSGKLFRITFDEDSISSEAIQAH